MSRPAKPATVRFYLDADVLGLAKVLATFRADFTYPGDPGALVRRRQRQPCPIESTAVKDTEWIPLVTAERWLIVTRDRRIQQHRAELHAVRTYGARMVALSAQDAGDTWSQLETFMTNWRGIERLVGRPGPFIYTCTRTTLRRVDLRGS